MGRSPLVAGPGDRLRYHARSKSVRAVATLTVLAALASGAWIGRDQVAEVFAQSSQSAAQSAQSDHSQSSAREIEIATARRTLAGIISDTAKAKENLPEGTDTSAYDAARKAADDALAGVDLVEMSKAGADLNAAARALEQVRSEAAAKATEEAKKAAEATEAQRQAAEAEAQRQAQQAETPSQTYTPEPTPSQDLHPRADASTGANSGTPADRPADLLVDDRHLHGGRDCHLHGLGRRHRQPVRGRTFRLRVRVCGPDGVHVGVRHGNRVDALVGQHQLLVELERLVLVSGWTLLLAVLADLAWWM